MYVCGCTFLSMCGGQKSIIVSLSIALYLSFFLFETMSLIEPGAHLVVLARLTSHKGFTHLCSNPPDSCPGVIDQGNHTRIFWGVGVLDIRIQAIMPGQQTLYFTGLPLQSFL